jgi:hypothetical protein
MSLNATLRENLAQFYRVSHIFSLTLDVGEGCAASSPTHSRY